MLGSILSDFPSLLVVSDINVIRGRVVTDSTVESRSAFTDEAIPGMIH